MTDRQVGAQDNDDKPEDDNGPALTTAERDAGMRWMTWDGVLAGVMVQLTGGVFLTGFALMVGAKEVAIGLLAGLPRFSALMQPVGSYFVERLGARKAISVWVFGPARALWLLVIALPLLGYVGGESRPALLLLFGVALGSSLLAGMAAVSWLAWMADLIPAGKRGAFFGRRTMLAGAVGAVVGFAAGKFVDIWGAQMGKGDAGGFFIVFAVGMACGLASWYTLVRCPEPRRRLEAPEERESFFSMLREAWSDGNFRMVIYAASILSFGVWLASPFFAVYMIKHMHLPYSLMALFTAVSAGGSLLMVRFWGRLTDHFGSHPVMMTCINGAAFLPLLWLLTAGGAWWPIIVGHFIGGASWSGYMLAQMNLMFKITPDRHKSVYLGIFYALDSLPTLIAPLIGGLLLQYSPRVELQLGSWTYVNYHMLFLLSGLTRFAATPALRRVKEPAARDVRHMIRVLSHFRSLNPVLGLQYYGHVVGDVAGRGTRRAIGAVLQTARRIRKHLHPDKLEGAD